MKDDTFQGWKACCPPGWHGIIDALSESMRFVCQDEWQKYFTVIDVKEKYGQLRVSVAMNPDGPELPENALKDVFDCMLALTVMAEHMSGYVCQVCGAPAETDYNAGWHHTTCAKCEEER